MLAEREGRLGDSRGARIIVEMPPRHSKSETVSHWFPVWLLNNWPHWRVILTSYEADFASSWGRKVRNTIQANERALRVRVSGDSAAANRWDTTAGGGMVTAGVGGPITGRGGDVLIVDDPIKNSAEANSGTIRDHIWEWWQSTAYTRLEPGAMVIVVMTRWHQDDLAGRLLREMQEGTGEPWQEIKLPAIAEGEDVLGRRTGEALWPARYNAEALARIRENVGPYVWDSLYQQRPTAPGGTIFQRDWFGNRYALHPDDEDGIKLLRNVVGRWISWDTALKDSQDSAYTAATVAELTADYRLMIREVYRERLTFPHLPAAITSLAARYDDGLLRGVIIEDKASGISALQTLRSSAPEWLRALLIPFSPQGDKETRAKQAAVWCANGSVLLPQPGEGVPWLFDFERELFEFPRSAYADQVDTFSQVVLYTEHLLAAGLSGRQGRYDDGDF